MLAKFRHFENFLLIGALSGVLVSFCYVEESVTLKILAIILAVISLVTAFRHTKSRTYSSRYEFLSLLTVYLGIFAAYNFLYLVNLPLYAAMVIIFILISLVTFSMFSLDKMNEQISREIFASIILLLGLVILQVFLALYFLSIDPILKSLIIIVIYYFLINLVYIYVNSMLRLKKVLGYLIISIIILAAIMMSVWFGLPK